MPDDMHDLTLAAAQEVIAKSNIEDGSNDRLFIERIYRGGIQKYIARIEAINFTGKRDVLDVGCGFGQWSLALSQLNSSVRCCDVAADRLTFLNDISLLLGIENMSTDKIEGIGLPYKDNTFDAIFCYQVLQYTAWEDYLHELFRILRPGGRIYVATNDIGWYLWLWYERHNPASDYDPKAVAAASFQDTLLYERNKKIKAACNLIIDQKYFHRTLEKTGFKILASGPDGSIKINGTSSAPVPFFEAEFRGFPMVYEVLCSK